MVLALGGALDFSEHGNAKADDAGSQEQGKQRIGGHKLEHVPHKGGKGAGGGQNGLHSGFDDFLKNSSFHMKLHKREPPPRDSWLRVYDSNVGFEVQSLVCYRFTNPRYM